MADLSIKAIITAVDRITGPIKKIAAGLRDKLGGSFKTIGGAITGAIGKLSDFAVSATKVAALGAGALALGIGVAGQSYLDNAGHLADMTSQLGIGAEALQELYYAAKLSGIGAEELDGALGTLSKGVGQAKAGTGKLYKFLEKVSPVLAKQVKAARSTEEAFALITAAIDKLPDAQRKAALATAAFGGSGQAMTRILADGTAGLDKQREAARQTGSVMSGKAVAAADDLGDSIDRLKMTAGGAAGILFGKLVPVLQPLVTQLTNWIIANRELIGQKLDGAFKAIGQALERIDWPATIQAVKDVAKFVGDLWTKVGGAGGAFKIYAGIMAVQMVPTIRAAIPVVGALISIFRVLFVTMMANPIVAVVALLIGAIALVIANWKDFEEFGAELWRTLKVLWIDGTKAIGDLWAALAAGGMQVWQDFKLGLSDLWDGIVGVFTAAWDKIGSIVERVKGAVRDVIGGARSVTDALGITDAAPTTSPMARGGGADWTRMLGPPVTLPGAGGLPGAAGAGRAEVSGGVTVRFENAPPGLRISQTTSGTPGLTVGASVGRRTMAAGIAL